MRKDCPGSPFQMCSFDTPNLRGPPGNDVRPTSDRWLSDSIPGSLAAETSDHSLIEWTRAGDQDAATNLHRRYVKRLTRLVERQCSTALARCAGVEDIVQSVFASFFRRIDQGSYDVPIGETAWKLLLIIALNAIRTQATYYNAAKRDTHRTIRGVLALQRLTLQTNTRDSAPELGGLVLKEILDRLPIRSRVLMRLRIDGHTIAEVARLAGRSMRTVERVIHESRLNLSGLLEVED